MKLELPAALEGWIENIHCSDIEGEKLEVCWTQEGVNLYCLTIRGTLKKNVAVGSWRLSLSPAFQPDFFYTPHLTPDEDSVIDMHVFRVPVMMMGRGERVLCALPVMDHVENGDNRWFMDLDAPQRRMTFGITTTQRSAHVLYRSTEKAVLPAGCFEYALRLMLLEGEETKNPFRPVLAWYWEKYGSRDSRVLPECPALMRYVQHTYDWALDRWGNTVWQEFELNGKRVGAPQLIVITKQSPNYTAPYSIREPKSIWNQAWFSSLRSAQGLYRYGKAVGRGDYVEKALMTKELALSFPQEDGLFDSVVGVPSEHYIVDGVEYERSTDWSQRYWGNSNRNPVSRRMEDSPRHILDMSWTALKMLEWYEELEKDERLLKYAQRYADRLITLQDEKGYFPEWLEKGTGRILPELRQSPECAVSVSLLVKLHELTGGKEYLESAFRCMDVLVREVMPESRWEDFETYWSCSRYGVEMLGKKFERNASYKQCSLSPFWMAQALYDCYMVTKDDKWLAAGERCLDEMLMYQSAFQPSYIPITVVGGFGVMNGDAELNDARQSLFAELILKYGRLLGRQEYRERGSAALRASFSMMYCPENPLAREQWEKKWPFFNEQDFGFMMENYGHDGYADGSSLGIGEFTIYDWGNGAASEAVMRIKNHFPELFEAE